MNDYTFADDDSINGSDPSGLAQASDVPCTIFASRCGDPLEFPGSMTAAAFGAFGWGGGNVSYGGVTGIAVAGGIAFANDSDHRLLNSWSDARRVLNQLADDGNIEARQILQHIEVAEHGALLWLFVNGTPSEGFYGETSIVGTVMIIDMARIDANTRDVVNVQSTMLHEFGHAWYKATAFIFNDPNSQQTALDFENVYRQGINWPPRTNYAWYPQR